MHPWTAARGVIDRAAHPLRRHAWAGIALSAVLLLSALPALASGKYQFVDMADPAPRTPATTSVYYWDSPGSDMLLFIPGGVGAASGDSHPLHRGLATLSDDSKTRGRIAVGIFESPYLMPYTSGFPVARASQDHLRRLETVIDHFRKTAGKSVWIMGHSMGGVSVSEFQKYLEKAGKQNLIAGIVYSNGFSKSEFGRDIQVPVLFLQHEKDRCSGSQVRDNRRVYDRVRQASKREVEFALITTGPGLGNEPCDSGHHMYDGSLEDVAREIERFILR